MLCAMYTSPAPRRRGRQLSFQGNDDRANGRYPRLIDQATTLSIES